MARPKRRTEQTRCKSCGKMFRTRAQSGGPHAMYWGDTEEHCPHCDANNVITTQPVLADFKFAFVTNVNRRTYAEPPLNTPAIKKVGKSFTYNMDRVYGLGRIPEACYMQWAWRLFALTPVELSLNRLTEVEVKNALHVMRHFNPNIDDLFSIVPDAPGFSDSIEGIFFAMVTGAWTAFETLAGDLWEAAVNTAPKRLSKLPGQQNRILQLVKNGIDNQLRSGKKSAKNRPSTRRKPAADDDGLPAERGSKKIDLDELGNVSGNSFDLSRKMGTLLRTKYEFNTLTKIREAFALAFDRPSVSQIDQALSSPAFDAIGLVRNVIVHRAGIADGEYIERIRGIPGAPKLMLGQRLDLDGETTFNLISLAVSQEAKLLRAVDEFLAHPPKEARDAK
jgi:hypothetical protein